MLGYLRCAVVFWETLKYICVFLNWDGACRSTSRECYAENLSEIIPHYMTSNTHSIKWLRCLLNHSCPWEQGSWGLHGAHLGPTAPRWAPCWPYESCYLGSHMLLMPEEINLKQDCKMESRGLVAKISSRDDNKVGRKTGLHRFCWHRKPNRYHVIEYRISVIVRMKY